MNCIIIDDEPLARALLKEYIAEMPGINVVAECGDGFEGIKAIQQHKPNFIFLDVQMPKLNGFEMLELIEQPIQVIFTTAFDEYALKAFETNAVDYLLKPFAEERLHKAVEKVKEKLNTATTTAIIETPIVNAVQEPRIVVKDKHQIHIIPYTDIVLLEAADDYVKIHLANKYFLKKKTLSHYESVLPATAFCRVHRSYIVALQSIHKVEPWEKDGAIITLKNNVEVPVSKAGYKVLKSALGI